MKQHRPLPTTQTHAYKLLSAFVALWILHGGIRQNAKANQPTTHADQERATSPLEKPSPYKNHEDEEAISRLIKEGNQQSEAGDLSKARGTWEEVLKQSERQGEQGQSNTVLSLINLGRICTLKGEYEKAGRLLQRALNISDTAPDIDQTYKAAGLMNLAELYTKLESYDKAETLYTSGLEIATKTTGAESIYTANILNGLAVLQLLRGRAEKAKPLLMRVIAIKEKAIGARSFDTATSIGNLGWLYFEEGDYGKAEELYLRALDIQQASLGPTHPFIAQMLSNLGLLYTRKGDYRRADELQARALAIREDALGKDSPQALESLNNLAYNYLEAGAYLKATELLETVISIGERALGPQSLLVAAALNNAGELYRRQGIYDKAESLHARALSIREKLLGMDNTATAMSLNNLGLTYSLKGDGDKAAPLLDRALSIYEKALGPNHPNLATVLNNLAELYREQGVYDKAEILQSRALAILAEELGEQHADTARSLNNLALIYGLKGDYSKALPLLARALSIYEKALGPLHPDVARVQSNLGLNYEGKGDHKNSEKLIRKAIRAELEIIQRDAPYLTRRERQGLIEAVGNTSEWPYTIVESRESISELALFSRINRQGLLEEVERRQSILIHSRGPAEKLAEELRILNIHLSSATTRNQERQNLRTRQEQVEKELYRLLPELKPRITEVDQVAAALPSGGALVELKKYRPFYGIKTKSQRWGDPQYIALILKPNGAVTAIQLGPAAPIESSINRALNASSENTSDAKDRWGEVSRLVLQPLASTLKGSTQWFISPDAELNRTPFAALPSPQDVNQPLGQSIQLHLLTTGRDLLRLREPVKAAQAPVVIANPNFNRVGRSSTAMATAKSSDVPQSRSADLVAKSWAPLPSSEREGQQIGTLLATRPITGNDATTQRLQQLISPRVLHIASHGFFVADVDNKPNDPLQALQDQSAMLRPFRGEDPQLRSGLVLAGANQPEADPNDDGYLTAAEAVSLQLDGTELVVLSACSTGQGDIRTGEGVYGLQRSLTVAGARSTLLSLWKVDDAATAEFMSRFYKRLKAGEGRSDALAATQKEFREGQVKDPKTGLAWDTPYYWAAWQLVGDWRPIKGL